MQKRPHNSLWISGIAALFLTERLQHVDVSVN